MKKMPRAALWTLSGLYAALMIWLLFLRSRGNWRSVNIIPLTTIREYLAMSAQGGYLARHAIVNLAGNVIMFIPLGFFPGALWPRLRRPLPCLLFCIGTVILVEGLQYLLWCGSADVDDLILNLCGAAIGCVIYQAASKRIS